MGGRRGSDGGGGGGEGGGREFIIKPAGSKIRGPGGRYQTGPAAFGVSPQNPRSGKPRCSAADDSVNICR